MEEKKPNEEIKLLGNKRKLEHDNFEEKEEDKNKIAKLNENNDSINKDKQEQNKNDDKNEVPLSIEKDKEKEKENTKEKVLIQEKEENVDICQKCNKKNKICVFKNGEELYNYLTSKNSGMNEDTKKLVEKKFKTVKFNQIPKVCENCMNNIILENKNTLTKLYSEDKKINPNNNLIKDNDINKNSPPNKDGKVLFENKKVLKENNNINKEKTIDQPQAPGKRKSTKKHGHRKSLPDNNENNVVLNTNMEILKKNKKS